MMLTKEEFVKAISLLSDLQDRWCRFQGAFDGVTDCQTPVFDTGIGLAFDLLSKIMEDRGDTIGYWFYEMDQGRDKSMGIFLIGTDTRIPMDTPGELYDYLTIKGYGKD
jgi:hypothetical protein